MFVTYHRQTDERLLERLNPNYWHPAYEDLLNRCRVPLVELDEFISHITYGPIVTGKQPPEVTHGIPIIHQSRITSTGVDLREAVIVPQGSDWDAPRARVRYGDILLPRSGVATLAQNRLTIFLQERPAVVGSFVDLVRLQDIDPVYAFLCFKTDVVWSQIHRRINGVGTVNISFREIKSLRFPLLPDAKQKHFAERYLKQVHEPHLRWLSGEDEAETVARENLHGLKQSLDGMLLATE